MSTFKSPVPVWQIWPLGVENKGGRGVPTPLDSPLAFLAEQPLFPNANGRKLLIANLAENGWYPDQPMQLHDPISTATREASEAEREKLFHNIPQMTSAFVEMSEGKKWDITSTVLMAVVTAMFKPNGKFAAVRYNVSAGYRRWAGLILANCIRMLKGESLILEVPAVWLDIKNDVDLINASVRSNNRSGTQNPLDYQTFLTTWTLKRMGRSMSEVTKLVGKPIQRNYNFCEFADAWPELNLRDEFDIDPQKAIKMLKAARPTDLNRLKERYDPTLRLTLKDAEEYVAKLRGDIGGSSGPKPVTKDRFTAIAKSHGSRAWRWLAALNLNSASHDNVSIALASNAERVDKILTELFGSLGFDMSDETIAFTLSGQPSANDVTAVEHDRIPEEAA